jgi:hypothetical protein
MPTATVDRNTYIKYMETLLGGYGPAQGLRNNDNKFNTWYYGRRVSGDDYAWCAASECYVENHFDILTINGGKVAYVPNMVGVAKRAGAKTWHKPKSVPKQGTSWAKPGNKLCFDFNKTGEAEHTGTFVRRLNSTQFVTYEGNTSTSKYSDAFAEKTRSVHDVLDAIELLGVADSAAELSQEVDDFMAKLQYVSLGMSKPQMLKAGEIAHANFDLEYGDGGDAHAGEGKGRSEDLYPGILSGGKNKTDVIRLSVEIPEAFGTWRLVETDPDKDYAVSKAHHIRKGSYTEGGVVEKGQHLYIELHPVVDGPVNVAVNGHYAPRD